MRLVTLKQAAAWYWGNSRMETVTTLKDSVGNLRSWRPCDYPKSLKTLRLVCPWTRSLFPQLSAQPGLVCMQSQTI